MSAQFCERVGSNIKRYRKEKGITLKQLANEIGLTEATVQKYEAGNIKKVDTEMLKKIADALDTTPERIAGWQSDEYLEHREKIRGEEEAKVTKMYSQLTRGHKKAVRTLMSNLLECQEKNSSNK